MIVNYYFDVILFGIPCTFCTPDTSLCPYILVVCLWNGLCTLLHDPYFPAPRIQFSGAIVTSQPWIRLTGGYRDARSGAANRVTGRADEGNKTSQPHECWVDDSLLISILRLVFKFVQVTPG